MTGATAIRPMSALQGRRRARRWSTGEGVLLAALAVWGLTPVVAMAIHALSTGDHLTGADGVIGADQLQYLAWVRDAGVHGLASNLFEATPSAHVFIQPLFAVSALLWRAGLPLVAAYWLWKPVAVIVLFAGSAALARRVLEGPSRLVATCLALFMLTPLASLVAWVAIGPASWRSDLLGVGAEMMPAGELWGYLPSALATGLMPIVLLSVERALGAERGVDRRGPIALAVVGALLVSWLHPWQGVVLVLLLAALAVWQLGGGMARERIRGLTVLGVAGVAAAAPLVYYFVLSKVDSAWRLAAHNELIPHPSVTALLAGLVPLMALAALGVRRPGTDLIERALILWIPAALVAYAALNAFPSHALESISLPLAILAVRGWSRLRLPSVAAAAVLVAVIVPGIVYDARAFHRVARSSPLSYYLTADEWRALRFIDTKAPAGAVIAPLTYALLVPSQTDRRVWVGHEFWSRDWARRMQDTAALFDGSLAPAAARQLVAGSGVRLLASDCAHRTKLEPILGSLSGAVHRFGCAIVYVVHGASER